MHVKNILNLNSFDYCLFINYWFSYLLRVIEELPSFPFCLSMPIDVIRHARVGVFYSLKTLITKIPNTRKLHYSHISLLFLFYFVTIDLYKFHSVVNCIMTSYLRMLTKLPKIAKITLFLGLCIPSLLFRCGILKKTRS